MALLTLNEIAERTGRSYAWARARAVDGRFEVIRPEGERRILVTEASFVRVLASECPAPKRGAHLRLVVNYG